MRRQNTISFAPGCQRKRGALWALAAVLWLAAAPGAWAVIGDLDAERGRGESVSDFFKRLSKMDVEGSFSLNWRNIGPRYPQYETQIQNEVYLSDMYFGLNGPFIDRVPFQVEWNMPTSEHGQIRLNQLNFSYDRVDNLKVQFGKFLVPFGRYNELYRPDQFLTVTRPLAYASPDSLDLVIRVNSPRPVVSAGYTDIGGRLSYYPPSNAVLIPDEITLYVVNGLGEATNRERTFPNTDNLGVPPIPGNGSSIDFGHQDNNIADNNNTKSEGGRLVWALGDVRFPWPVPEGVLDLNGLNLGVSGMGGQFDLESDLNYQVYGADLSFDYLGYNFSGEYVHSLTQFLVPLEPLPASATTPADLTRDFEIIQGYFVQASFPVIRKPGVGQRVNGVLVFNQFFRRGPNLDLFLNQTINGTQFPSLGAMTPNAPRTTTHLEKYTAALNWQLTEHFNLKFEYSYWTMGRASTRNNGLTDIYQTAFSLVAGF